MAGTTPILSLEYRISREDFTAYSTRSMERQYALRARRANRSGTVKLAVGLIAAVYVGWAVSAGVISRERGNTPAILFAAALLVYGGRRRDYGYLLAAAAAGEHQREQHGQQADEYAHRPEEKY